MDTLSPHADNGNIPLKRCRTCPEPEENRWHPATPEYFGRDKSRVDGLSYQCKRCKSEESKTRRKEHPETQKRYYTAHREEKLQYAAQYRSEHKEEHAEYCAKYNVEHREELGEKRAHRYIEHRQEYKERNARNYKAHYADRRQYASKYRAEHPEQVEQYRVAHRSEHRLYDRAYHLQHQEEKRLYRTKYCNDHYDELRAYQKLYRQTERGRIAARTNAHNRRSRKRNAPGSHTTRELYQQLKRQKNRCYYCNAKLGNGRDSWHGDHVIPLIKGGSNSIDNIVIACPTCNMRKSGKMLHEWIEGGRLL